MAQLAEQVEQNQSATTCPNGNVPTLQALARWKRENDARRDLLLALGITASTQDIFIRALAIRTPLATTHGTEILQGGSASDGTVNVSHKPKHLSSPSKDHIDTIQSCTLLPMPHFPTGWLPLRSGIPRSITSGRHMLRSTLSIWGPIRHLANCTKSLTLRQICFLPWSCPLTELILPPHHQWPGN